MKKIYMSMVAAAVLSTGAYAESNSIKEAFANGKVSGDISIYTDNVSSDSGDTSYTNSSIGIEYETDSFNGFKAAVGGRTNHLFSEKNDKSDYSDGTDPEAVLTTANISYTADMGSLTVGRQAIDLEWIGDYHEAVIGAVTAIPDTTIIIGHTTRMMVADPDGALEKMSDITDSGASVIDIKYAGIENTELNAYYMDADDLMSAYGLKATTSIEGISLLAHYAATSEDVSGTEDGSIAHFEIGTTVSDISLAAGYITTDKDGGIGSLDALGENIDPFEAAGEVYSTDADTFYASISADVSMVTLGAFYGETEYGTNDDKISEFNVSASTAITDELVFDVVYATTDAEDSVDDVDYVWAMLTYSF